MLKKILSIALRNSSHNNDVLEDKDVNQGLLMQSNEKLTKLGDKMMH